MLRSAQVRQSWSGTWVKQGPDGPRCDRFRRLEASSSLELCSRSGCRRKARSKALQQGPGLEEARDIKELQKSESPRERNIVYSVTQSLILSLDTPSQISTAWLPGRHQNFLFTYTVTLASPHIKSPEGLFLQSRDISTGPTKAAEAHGQDCGSLPSKCGRRVPGSLRLLTVLGSLGIPSNHVSVRSLTTNGRKPTRLPDSQQGNNSKGQLLQAEVRGRWWRGCGGLWTGLAGPFVSLPLSFIQTHLLPFFITYKRSLNSDHTGTLEEEQRSQSRQYLLSTHGAALSNCIYFKCRIGTVTSLFHF